MSFLALYLLDLLQVKLICISSAGETARKKNFMKDFQTRENRMGQKSEKDLGLALIIMCGIIILYFYARFAI